MSIPAPRAKKRTRGIESSKSGCYCTSCGEYKPKEHYAGRGHAAYICHACKVHPPDPQIEAVIIARINALPLYMSGDQKRWLYRLCSDSRLSIATEAKALYQARFPTEVWEERRLKLRISRIVLRLYGVIPRERNAGFYTNCFLSLYRKSGEIEYRYSGKKDVIRLSAQQMAKLLESIVKTYEVFSWEQYDTLKSDSWRIDWFGEADEAPPTPLSWKVTVRCLNCETYEMGGRGVLPYQINELAVKLMILRRNRSDFSIFEEDFDD